MFFRYRFALAVSLIQQRVRPVDRLVLAIPSTKALERQIYQAAFPTLYFNSHRIPYLGVVRGENYQIPNVLSSICKAFIDRNWTL